VESALYSIAIHGCVEEYQERNFVDFEFQNLSSLVSISNYALPQFKSKFLMPSLGSES
jgi:hypothetical protein